MKTNEDEKTEEQKLADELMIWLPKISAGTALEFLHDVVNTDWHEILDVNGLIRELGNESEIRIKAIAFPDAPEGEEWQNPDNLTAEQVGIEDGWRLLLVSEIYHRETSARISGCIWMPSLDIPRWSIYGRKYGEEKFSSYRVKASDHPVGSLKPKVEEVEPKLTIEDLLELDKQLAAGYPKPIDRPGEQVNPLDESEHKAIFEDLVEGFRRLTYSSSYAETLAAAVMDGSISKHIRIE